MDFNTLSPGLPCRSSCGAVWRFDSNRRVFSRALGVSS